MKEAKIIHRINVKETLMLMKKGQEVDIDYTECKTETLRNIVWRLKKDTNGRYEYTVRAKPHSTIINRI